MNKTPSNKTSSALQTFKLQALCLIALLSFSLISAADNHPQANSNLDNLSSVNLLCGKSEFPILETAGNTNFETTGRLNVRIGPSKECRIIEVLPTKQAVIKLKRIETPEREWAYLTWFEDGIDKFGWASGKFLTQIESVDAPVVETPVVETPVVETPVVETPVVETPVVETPVVETPVVETPVVETPVVETPVVETPVVETPVVETPVVETPVVETPIVETPIVETPVIETPVVETPVVETPVIETPVIETPMVETPVVETPVIETPVIETPVVETAVAETPVIETPVVEAPVAETPVVETKISKVDILDNGLKDLPKWKNILDQMERSHEQGNANRLSNLYSINGRENSIVGADNILVYYAAEFRKTADRSIVFEPSNYRPGFVLGETSAVIEGKMMSSQIIIELGKRSEIIANFRMVLVKQNNDYRIQSLDTEPLWQ